VAAAQWLTEGQQRNITPHCNPRRPPRTPRQAPAKFSYKPPFRYHARKAPWRHAL